MSSRLENVNIEELLEPEVVVEALGNFLKMAEGQVEGVDVGELKVDELGLNENNIGFFRGSGVIRVEFYLDYGVQRFGRHRFSREVDRLVTFFQGKGMMIDVEGPFVLTLSEEAYRGLLSGEVEEGAVEDVHEAAGIKTYILGGMEILTRDGDFVGVGDVFEEEDDDEDFEEMDGNMDGNFESWIISMVICKMEEFLGDLASDEDWKDAKIDKESVLVEKRGSNYEVSFEVLGGEGLYADPGFVYVMEEHFDCFGCELRDVRFVFTFGERELMEMMDASGEEGGDGIQRLRGGVYQLGGQNLLIKDGRVVDVVGVEEEEGDELEERAHEVVHYLLGGFIEDYTVLGKVIMVDDSSVQFRRADEGIVVECTLIYLGKSFNEKVYGDYFNTFVNRIQVQGLGVRCVDCERGCFAIEISVEEYNDMLEAIERGKQENYEAMANETVEQKVEALRGVEVSEDSKNKFEEEVLNQCQGDGLEGVRRFLRRTRNFMPLYYLFKLREREGMGEITHVQAQAVDKFLSLADGGTYSIYGEFLKFFV